MTRWGLIGASTVAREWVIGAIHAAGGEVVLSARLARVLPGSVGVPELVMLKGKQEPVEARRVRWFAGS